MIDDQNEATELFRALYLADLEGAGDRGLVAYKLLFPGQEALIEELHQRMSLSPADAGAAQERTSLGLDTSVGARVGHFRIEKEIGRGGQAVVFKALDEKLGRPVALKVLIRATHRGDAGMQRFKREAEVCSRLNHKSICRVYDTGIEGGFPYIAMELVDGLQLTDSARSGTSLTSEFHFSSESIVDEEESERMITESRLAYLPDRPQIIVLIKIFIKISEALEAAHQAGVIHRDIKPGNIMLRQDMSPVILDFGLAQDLDSEVHALTQTGDFFGTPAYMSPEQISAHRIRLDSRSDIFSLGASFYECLCGRRPFDATTRDGIYQAILTKEPPLPRSLHPEIPKDLEVVIGKSLEKDRDRRYQTAAEFAADLQRILDFEPILAKPAGFGLRLLRWSQRNRAAAISLVLVPVLIAAVAITTVVIQNRRDSRAAAQLILEDRESLAQEFDELSALYQQPAAQIILIPRLQRRMAGRVLRLGDMGRELVLERLNSDRESDRVAALFLLAAIPEYAPLDAIVRVCLEDEVDYVQICGTQVLMRIDTEGVVAAQRQVFEATENVAARVNALFGMILNDVSDGPDLALSYLKNADNDLSIRQVLAMNLMMLGRTNLNPTADWLEENLTASQMNEWGALIGHHESIGAEENVAALLRISEREDLSPMMQEHAAKAKKSVLEKKLQNQVD